MTLLAVPGASDAQVPAGADAAAVDSLRAEVERLQARVDSLMEVVRGLAPADGAEDEIERLRAAARDALRDAGDEQPEPIEQEPVGRERSLQALNPEITVTADFFGIVAEEDPDEGNFSAREFELSFQSALDPYSRAKIFVGYHRPDAAELDPFGSDEEGHGEDEVEIEEGYIEWVGLPGGLGVTLGRFRQRLGTYNRWHAHALPGQSYFLPYRVFFGEEGLAQTGVSLHWLAPFEGAGAYEAWLEITGSDNPFFGASRRPSYLAHVNAFWETSNSTYVELGVTGVTGTLEDETGSTVTNRLLHVEGAFNWRPPERALYRELNVRGAIMLNGGGPEQASGSLADSGTALGAFALAELRLGRQWWIGGRFDFVENPADPDAHAWLLAPTLAWWQSEWVRIRAEYDLLDGPTGRQGLFLIQTTISMGPHRHETY